MTDTVYGTIDLCQCCMLCAANGECCAEPHDDEPLSKITRPYSITFGLLEDEHSDRCTPADREAGCDCDSLGFCDWNRCGGCGSSLAGDRWRLTLWREPCHCADAGEMCDACYDE